MSGSYTPNSLAEKLIASTIATAGLLFLIGMGVNKEAQDQFCNQYGSLKPNEISAMADQYNQTIGRCPIDDWTFEERFETCQNYQK